MKKIFSIILIIILAFPAYFRLLKPGYFSMHDDLQVMRIYEMEMCMNDGQIPCRWVSDMVFGYGQAMFNYYSAAPYYLGVIIRALTSLSILATIKMLFLISLLGSGIGMYLLARELWGDTGGIASGLSYIYAPYHALDIYVRGAMSESFALMILPFLWLYIYKAIKTKKFKHIVFAGVWLAALLTTHNISTMIMAPFTILWAGYWVFREKNLLKSVRDLVLIGLIGIGLGAFFIIPAFFELNLVSADLFKEDYFTYHIHFVSIRQLFFDREWGYGPSAFGDNDDLSFQIGIVHWVGVLLTLFVYIAVYIRNKRRINKDMLLVGGIVLMFLGSAFMTHQRSYMIWENINKLQFVQFPWRFLGLTIFFASLALGAKFKYMKILKVLTLPVLLFFLITLNGKYFMAEHYFPFETDQTKLSGTLFEIQQKAAPLDYLPKTVNELPKEISRGPKIIEGRGDFSNFSYQTNRFFFDASIYEKSSVEIPVIYFPNWIVLDSGHEIGFELHDNRGTIVVNLSPGKHMVHGRFVNTVARDIANGITVMSLVALIGTLIIYENKGKVLWYKK